jgi:hypothetical protein
VCTEQAGGGYDKGVAIGGGGGGVCKFMSSKQRQLAVEDMYKCMNWEQWQPEAKVMAANLGAKALTSDNHGRTLMSNQVRMSKFFPPGRLGAWMGRP